MIYKGMYVGGCFKFQLRFKLSYPIEPPKVRSLQKVHLLHSPVSVSSTFNIDIPPKHRSRWGRLPEHTPAGLVSCPQPERNHIWAAPTFL